MGVDSIGVMRHDPLDFVSFDEVIFRRLGAVLRFYAFLDCLGALGEGLIVGYTGGLDWF